MKEKGVLLSRRKTGGGAVYQDLGNTCFSFLTPYDSNQAYDYKTVNNQIMINTFNSLGVPAEAAGRNDITCEGKKVLSSYIVDIRISLPTLFRRKGWPWKKGSPSWDCSFQCRFASSSKILKPQQKKTLK